jgi:uncharacterized protein
VKPVELTSVDGIRLDAVLHLPDGRPSRALVILAHGITVDLHEGGMFVRLADRLCELGLAAIRFSFRGHGNSEGSQRGVTIAGEMLDLQAATEYAIQAHPDPLSIVAASFGAVPTAISLPYLEDHLTGLVLWNPVLDLRHTFLDPQLPWGLENFAPERQNELRQHGFLLVDGEFQLGRVLFEEFAHYKPEEYFVSSGVPALVIHGDRDSYVSYEVARRAAARPRCEFHTVRGSDHGFDSRDREDEAIRVTVDWLARRHGIHA